MEIPWHNHCSLNDNRVFSLWKPVGFAAGTCCRNVTICRGDISGFTFELDYRLWNLQWRSRYNWAWICINKKIIYLHQQYLGNMAHMQNWDSGIISFSVLVYWMYDIWLMARMTSSAPTILNILVRKGKRCGKGILVWLIRVFSNNIYHFCLNSLDWYLVRLLRTATI